MLFKIRVGVFAALWLSVSGCGGTPATTSPLPPRIDLTRTSGPGRYVKHIVIAIQENRSFDNVFDGFPGADTLPYGYTHDHIKVRLRPIPFQQRVINHGFSTAVMDWDHGKMDRFDLDPSLNGNVIGTYAYSYLERRASQPYWTIAKRFVLADHMFPTIMGPSFTAHLSLIAGTADLSPTESEADFPTANPWGCDAAVGTTTHVVNPSRVVSGGGPFPCFSQFRTMASTLDAARVSWKYYAPAVGDGDGQSWSAFDAIPSVRYGPDWSTHIVSPPQQILADAAQNKLPAVSWVVPDFDWSDHPQSGTPYGPSWIASIVNAIGGSKDWKSTAIIVVWDDWGGFYDNVRPPQRDFRGLGIRVGCLIISPYVRRHVSHTVYEFGSILKFVEETFGLPPLGATSLGYTDERAQSIVDSFDFTMHPRRFARIPAPFPARFFLTRKPSLRAPDDE